MVTKQKDWAEGRREEGCTRILETLAEEPAAAPPQNQPHSVATSQSHVEIHSSGVLCHRPGKPAALASALLVSSQLLSPRVLVGVGAWANGQGQAVSPHKAVHALAFSRSRVPVPS